MERRGRPGGLSILSTQLRRGDGKARRCADGRGRLCRNGGGLASGLRGGRGRGAGFLRNATSRPLRSAAAPLKASACSPAIMSRKSAAAARRQGAFQTPVYGLPSDLVRADLGLFNAKLQGEHISGRVEGRAPGALCRPAPRSMPRASPCAGAVLYRRPDRFFLPANPGLGPGACSMMAAHSTTAHRLCRREWPALYRHRPHPDRRRLADARRGLAAIHPRLAEGPSGPRARGDGNRPQLYLLCAKQPLGDPALGSTGTLGVGLTPLASLAVDPRLHALGRALLCRGRRRRSGSCPD